MTQGAQERDPWIKIRAGDIDPRRCRGKLTLGATDVRTARDHFLREPDRQLGGQHGNGLMPGQTLLQCFRLPAGEHAESMNGRGSRKLQ